MSQGMFVIWKSSWSCLIEVFFKLRMVLGAHVGLCVREPNFLQKSFPRAKITKNGKK